MKYPRCIYLIFPRRENGLVAGVYVGSAVELERRIDCHRRCFYKGRKQDELHTLMRNNGYYYGIVDEIADETQKMKEHDWIDYFVRETSLEVFNTVICKEANWQRIENPQQRINDKFGVLENGQPFWERTIKVVRKSPKKSVKPKSETHKVKKSYHMKITDKTNYPVLAEHFRSQTEMAKFLHWSERTIRRSMSGDRPFSAWEIRKLEEYTGIPREELLRRR